ncbi:MAG: hypothetical protein AB1806_19165 [Acidobacteriota bacterium]
MRHRFNARLMAAAVVTLIAAASSVAGAQSLGELARREEARRKAIKTPAKVYTNDSLLPARPATPPADTATGSSSAPGSAAGSTPAERVPPGSAERTPEDPRRTEAYWRERMTNARQQQDRNRVYMDALQSRINALWADFTARDDPAQRAIIAAERQRALDELERLKQEQANLDRQVLEIEEDARRSGIPPGWIR